MVKQVSELEEGTELSLFESDTEFSWMGEEFRVRNGTVEFLNEMSFLSMQVIDSKTLIGIASSYTGQKAYVCRKEDENKDHQIISLRDFDEEISEKFRNGEISSRDLLAEVNF